MVEDGDQVAALISGFIVWLARQRYEQDYRHRCAIVAEQFLRWQTRRQRQQLPSDVNAYCRELAIDGANDCKLNDTRCAIREYDQFARATS